MTDALRQDAATQLQALLDETSRFSNPAFVERRVAQCSVIIKCIDEQEQFIHLLQAQQRQFIELYLDLLERTQRMVYLCESHDISYIFVGGDTYLTAARLAKIRTVFPHVRLDAIPDKVYDWLLLDDMLEDAEKDPNSINWKRLEEFTIQIENKYGHR